MSSRQKIGEWTIYDEAGKVGHGSDRPCVDATFERAIAAGTSSLGKPADRPFQERTAAVKDAFGNIWYLATYAGNATK